VTCTVKYFSFGQSNGDNSTQRGPILPSIKLGRVLIYIYIQAHIIVQYFNILAK